MKLRTLLSVSGLLLFLGQVTAQCNPMGLDNFVSSYHATVAKQPDGTFMVWGEDMANDGASDILSPTTINAALYPSLTGTVLFASLGSKGAAHTGQGVLLTTTGLFAWGNEGGILDPSITTGTAFQQLTINGETDGLPAGVNPADVKMIFSSYHLLSILTNSGFVYVIAQTNTEVRGAGPTATSSTQWYQVTSSNGGNPPISNIIMIKGNGRGTMMALPSVADGNPPYIWGVSTFKGDGTGATALDRAVHVTMPSGVIGPDVKLMGLTSRDGETSTFESSFFLLTNSGSLYAIGDNSTGQLGDFTTTTRTTWVNVKKTSVTNFTDCIFFSPQEHDEENPSVNAIDAGYTIYNWGQNANQMLGRSGNPLDPGIPDGFTPGTDKSFAIETGGDFTIHIKDGSPKYCFAGQQANGSMGDGTGNTAVIGTFDCANTGSSQLCAGTSIDGGDAPLSFEGNGTTDLCVHNITAPNAGTLYLGTVPPSANNINFKNVSAGADNTGSNGDGTQEDGLPSVVKQYFNSGSYTVSISVTNTSGSSANLYGWVDWNRDGDFLDAGENTSVVVPNGATSADLTWTGVAVNLVPGIKHYLRLRLTTNTLTSPLGYASDGEVEDYFLKVAHINPDINVTRINLTINGNVTTNDIAPAGTTYGTPVADGGNPGPALPTMNANGTYSFVSAIPGAFNFDVPVCPPGQSTGCALTNLKITVLNIGFVMPPVANTDIAMRIAGSTFSSINTLANDLPTNPGTDLVTSSVTIISPPANGSAAVFPGSGFIAYSENPGYVGTDTLTYQVCDNSIPTPQCAIAKQIIRILPAGAENSTEATDDYIQAISNSPVSDNVLSNDKDPEGNIQSTVPQDVTIPGKGRFVLNSTGDYTFTPALGPPAFRTQVEFPYTKCDDGTPQACKDATLYIIKVSAIILPVKLESFTANLSQCAVTLNWKVALETNFSSYYVEYSKDGRNYSTIATIPARGNNSRYQAIHNSPLDGKAYYRLRMVDIDGYTEYSPVATLKINCLRSLLSVFPTPVTNGKLNVNIANLNGVFDSKLFNSTGQLVINKKISGGKNTIDVSKLAPGIYYLHLEIKGETENFRILIQ